MGQSNDRCGHSIDSVSRRGFLKSGMVVAGGVAVGRLGLSAENRDQKPNVLFIMCDQQRSDTIAALGNPHIYTPNFDRLVRRGLAFNHAYSTCPVCVPARYTIRTGCEPPLTGVYQNQSPAPVEGQPKEMEQRCGKFLARTMKELGYRTFGIGKFHTQPWNEDVGYETQLHTGELYGTAEQRAADSYASFIAQEHPEYDWIDMLHGERTDMYYMPQMSPLPAELTVEGWAASRAVEQIKSDDGRPYFGLVSFIGPHPPFAPPQPFNRMYDPDRMPNPIRGKLEIDHMDEQIPWMNYIIWAEDINNSHSRVLKARYYGEISYIGWCLGKILDAVEKRPDSDNTLICFFADHGDHLGDHHGWQKESYFDAACRIPFLISWPKRLPVDERRDELICLTDLFGIATSAAGRGEFRDGADVLGYLKGTASPRDFIIGYYGTPGSADFKIMVRDQEWKYIYMANGGREQLFNMKQDPQELHQQIHDKPQAAARLRQEALRAVSKPSANRALDGKNLRAFPFRKKRLFRIQQFCPSRGVRRYPEHPEDALKTKKLI